MKLSSFIAGIFGIMGFVLSVLAGLGTGNAFDTVLWRALLWAGACYVIGYGVGLIAQQVSLEHAQHVAKLAAEHDARQEQEALEEQASQEAAMATGPPAAPPAGAPASAGPAPPGGG